MISHIGISSYHLAKYLAQLLETLSESQYMIKLLKTLLRNWETEDSKGLYD